jgi:uncharacterized protein (DUF1800 family)
MSSSAPSAPESSTATDVPVNAERPSRRSFMFFGAMAAASLVPGLAQGQQAKARKRPSVPHRANDVPASAPSDNVMAFAEWDTVPSRLVRRITLGVTAAEMTRARDMGFQAYLNYQLNHTRIDDNAVEADVAVRWPLLAQTNQQLFAADAGQVRAQLQEATIYRAAFSQRQLYHRMVEFWSDHFNQDIAKVGYLLVADQRDVIRKNALGKFPDLLRASAHSASMMAYLDQNASRNTAPNQNYAREIMELHTLGVDGGYTQTDVAELARVLTGWTIQGQGQFYFNPLIHDWGAKTVLGVTIPAGSPSLGQAGMSEGEQMLNVLVNHPSTARFIATKMLKWLLDPNPSETQISTIAAVYTASGEPERYAVVSNCTDVSEFRLASVFA